MSVGGSADSAVNTHGATEPQDIGKHQVRRSRRHEDAERWRVLGFGHHREIQNGGWRAAVFGMSDGLVTNVSLILGMAGAHPAAGVVRLAGIAGLIAGAFSMASGEFVSMRAQIDLFERELALERHEIHRRPEAERHELARIYELRGIDPELASTMATELMRTPEMALETHAREELGIDPTSLGSPVIAATASFATFAVGAFVPLLPWLFASGGLAVLLSASLTLLVTAGIGIALSILTERPWYRTVSRQIVVSALAASVTYGVGWLVGTGVKT